MKVLITGGAGFIGSSLADRLLNDGHCITILDNLDGFYSLERKRANLNSVALRGAFELFEKDVRDANEVAHIVRRVLPDVIVHLAGRAGVRPSIREPLLYVQVNVHGTTSILEAACQAGIPKFVFASSSAVYGSSSALPFVEADTATLPMSPYGATKLAAEKMCIAYSQLYALNITCLRFFTVYGPRQRPDLAIYKFTELIEAGLPVPIYGAGRSSRDYTYSEDIVSGINAAIHYEAEPFSVFNLGNSAPVPLIEMVQTLEEVLGKRATLQWLPEELGDMPATYADISKAQQDLGYRTKTPFPEGVAKFVDWYRREVSR